MQRQDVFWLPRLAASALAGVLFVPVLFVSAQDLLQPRYVVSQKGREFTPSAVTIGPRESIVIVNDDADLRHHAYIDSDNFNFDSGDQEPGAQTTITFPAVGTFNVLCAIHPKMKLTVTVR